MQLDEILVPSIIFGCFAYAWRMLLDYKTRKLLIEKGLVDEKAKFLYQKAAEGQVPSTLKWGMVLIGLGLAIFIAQAMPDNQEEYAIALMALFGGIALVAYHTVVQRWITKQSA